MTAIPAKTDLTGASVTQGTFKTNLDQLIDALNERLVAGTTPITNFSSTGINDTASATFMAVSNTQLQLGQAGGAASIFHRVEDDQFVRLYGGNGVSSGGGILCYGPSHATLANEVRISTGAQLALRFAAATNTIQPGADNLLDLGTASLRFQDLFLVNAPTVSSGAEGKEQIQDSPLGLAFLETLQPRIYRLTGGTRFHCGFIAEEVEQAIIDAGHTTDEVAAFVRAPLLDEDDAPVLDETLSPKSRLGLRYQELTGVIVMGVKELATRVTQAEAALAALAARVDALENPA